VGARLLNDPCLPLRSARAAPDMRRCNRRQQTAYGAGSAVAASARRRPGQPLFFQIDPMALRPYDPTSTSGHSRQHTEVFRLAEAGKCSLNGSDLALQAKYGGDRLKQSDWL
jgi:hypothetical protein